MPGNLAAAAPSTVLPRISCTAYEQTRSYEVSVSEYPDGSSQREVKASSPRRSWRLTERLSVTALAALRQFFADRKGGTEPFYMYDPFESTPFGNYDATGVSTNGRFTVCFTGSLEVVRSGPGRAEASFSLIEAA